MTISPHDHAKSDARKKSRCSRRTRKRDEQFSGSESIVSQGVRSTICAPLITESNVHGVVYADRLDPFAAFSPTIWSLSARSRRKRPLPVETVKAHKRLAREEVARANYSRFMPEYVVKQMLENPGFVPTRRRQSDDYGSVCRHSRLYGDFRK